MAFARLIDILVQDSLRTLTQCEEFMVITRNVSACFPKYGEKWVRKNPCKLIQPYKKQVFLRHWKPVHTEFKLSGLSGSTKALSISSSGLPAAPVAHLCLREDGTGSVPRTWSRLGLVALKFPDTERQKQDARVKSVTRNPDIQGRNEAFATAVRTITCITIKF